MLFSDWHLVRSSGLHPPENPSIDALIIYQGSTPENTTRLIHKTVKQSTVLQKQTLPDFPVHALEHSCYYLPTSQTSLPF